MEKAVEILERSSVGLIAAAASAGIFLGSGVSTTARTIFGLLSIAAFATTFAAMLLQGRLHWVKGPLALLPAALALYGFLQITPLPNLGGFRATAAWLPIPRNSSLIVSANRHQTLQASMLLFSGALLTLAASLQLRSAARFRFVALTLGACLLLSGVGGAIQQSARNRDAFGLAATDRAGPIVRDIFTTETALGTASYRPWETVHGRPIGQDEINGSWPFFRPKRSLSLFAGFLDSRHWMICVSLLAPLFAAIASQFAAQASIDGKTEWFGTWEGRRSLFWISMSVAMTSLAAWSADPIVVPISIVCGGFAGVLFMRSAERRRFAAIMGTALIASSAVGAARLATTGGFSSLADRIADSIRDNRACLAAFREHPWFGCGMGAFGDILPLYREVGAEKPLQSSSLLAAVVEIGSGGIALLVVATLAFGIQYGVGRRRRDSHASILIAGCVAAFAAMIAAGTAGPGIEAPALFGMAAVLLGCLTRGLAGGFSNANARLAA